MIYINEGGRDVSALPLYRSPISHGCVLSSLDVEVGVQGSAHLSQVRTQHLLLDNMCSI